MCWEISSHAVYQTLGMAFNGFIGDRLILGEMIVQLSEGSRDTLAFSLRYGSSSKKAGS